MSFELDGTSYDLDLSKKNAAAFREAFDRYVDAARRQGGSRATKRRRASTATANGAKRPAHLVDLDDRDGQRRSTLKVTADPRGVEFLARRRTDTDHTDA